MWHGTFLGRPLGRLGWVFLWILKDKQVTKSWMGPRSGVLWEAESLPFGDPAPGNCSMFVYSMTFILLCVKILGHICQEEWLWSHPGQREYWPGSHGSSCAEQWWRIGQINMTALAGKQRGSKRKKEWRESSSRSCRPLEQGSSTKPMRSLFKMQILV